jgi:AcrR family transcriptional regulator
MTKKPGSAKAEPGSARARAASQEPRKRVITVALALVAERGWRDLALADIAAAASLSLAELYALYPSKQAILDAFVRDVDMAVLGETKAAPEGPAKDRLFDVLMRRLDKLDPHKVALQRIAGDTARDPLQVLCGFARLDRSMAAMLEAAGISAGGVAGILRAKGLTAVYLTAMRAWLRDESEDKAKTMAALDRALGRAEFVAGGFRRPSRRGEGSAEHRAAD